MIHHKGHPPFSAAEVSVFTFHRSDEGVSVNTVAVVPGATEALSGGDDQQATWHGEFTNGNIWVNHNDLTVLPHWNNG